MESDTWIKIINHWDLWVSTLSSLAALGAVFVAYRTLREMKIQRKATMKPGFTIPDIDFKVFWYPKENGLPLLWVENNDDLPETMDTEVNHISYTDLYFNLFNIGVGTAKRVKIEYTFDLDDFVSIIQEMNVEGIFNIENTGAAFIESEKISVAEGITPFTEFDLEYILPINIHDKPKKIYLFESYLGLTSLFIYLHARGFKMDEDKSTKFFGSFISKQFDIPPLKVNINYTDIEGEEYTSQFNFTPKFRSISSKTNTKEWKEACIGRFEIDEIT